MIVAQEGCAERELELPQEVCEEDEAIFEDAEHGQFAALLRRSDLGRERSDALCDLRRVENLYDSFIHQAATPKRTRQAKTAHYTTGRLKPGFILKAGPPFFNH